MAIKRFYITVELLAGTILGPTRVLAADKIATENTCRNQNWPYTDSPRIHLLMGYHALKREGASYDNFQEFLNDVADYAVDNDDNTAQGAEEDPTPGRQS